MSAIRSEPETETLNVFIQMSRIETDRPCFETPPVPAPQHEVFLYIYKSWPHAEERLLARLEAWDAEKQNQSVGPKSIDLQYPSRNNTSVLRGRSRKLSSMVELSCRRTFHMDWARATKAWTPPMEP